ncbi:hypothetical protein NECID01_0172 [Nematocida sp. AWRm77]|nr:hypothetical protein NECID01_0172 [Nematocida sp. AWRm77]
MIMNFRPKYENLMRDIYKKDGSVDEQKLSFFKHYLQQKPMKISESMGTLRTFSKKFGRRKRYMEYLTTLRISAHLIQDYSMFSTSFEVAALKLVKTHVKEIIKVFTMTDEHPRGFIDQFCEELKKCFFLFTYAGTRSSKAEKLTAVILIILCTAIDSGFVSAPKDERTSAEWYGEIEVFLAGVLEESEDGEGPPKEGGLDKDGGKGMPEYSEDVDKSVVIDIEKEDKGAETEEEYDSDKEYRFENLSYNYTDDRSSSSSSSCLMPKEVYKNIHCRNKEVQEAVTTESGKEEEKDRGKGRGRDKDGKDKEGEEDGERGIDIDIDRGSSKHSGGSASEEEDSTTDNESAGEGEEKRRRTKRADGRGKEKGRGRGREEGRGEEEKGSEQNTSEDSDLVSPSEMNIPGGLEGTVTFNGIINSITGLSISHNTLPMFVKGEVSKEYIAPDLFAVKSDQLESVCFFDGFLLELLSLISKTSGLLINSTEKKVESLNKALIKAAPFNIAQRQEIFTTYLKMLPPNSVEDSVKSVIKVASERKIPNVQSILYSAIGTDLYSDIVIGSNIVLSEYKYRIFEGEEVEKFRASFSFSLLQIVQFVNMIWVSVPPARMTKSFHFLLRSLFPKKSLFKKIVASDSDTLDRALVSKYFRLFASKCQDQEIVFLSLLRRTFPKELGVNTFSLPFDLKFLVVKDIEYLMGKLPRCASLDLLSIFLDLAVIPSLHFREQIYNCLIIMVEKDVLTKRSQFEEPKKQAVFARIRMLAVRQGGLYVRLLVSSLKSITTKEIKLVAGVFSAINETAGLNECAQYVDLSEAILYDISEDTRICAREPSIQGGSIKSGTTFSGERKSRIRLLDLFKKPNK